MDEKVQKAIEKASKLSVSNAQSILTEAKDRVQEQQNKIKKEEKQQELEALAMTPKEKEAADEAKRKGPADGIGRIC